MNRVKNATVIDARSYFSSELKSMLGKHQVKARLESVAYLTELLLRFLPSQNFFETAEDGTFKDNILSDIYRDYLLADSIRQKVLLQRLGDICLMISGFFAESVNRKTVDIDYYFGMGGTAYQKLSHLQPSEKERAVFDELATKFQPFSNVLGEMSEKSGLQSNKDIIRLYERWLTTGSERLRQVLSEQGIKTPVAVTPKAKH